jgi:polar amino acid transport system substrate-binding protein
VYEVGAPGVLQCVAASAIVLSANTVDLLTRSARSIESVPRGTSAAKFKARGYSRKTMTLLRIFLASVVAVIGCSPKPGAKELVVGMDLSYPPFETIDESGKPAGISVELARALADTLQRPLRIENLPFVGLIPSLQNGRIDCIISSMTDTPERRQSIAFSDPYLSTGLALLAGANADFSNSIDRQGRTLVVRQGTTGELWARANLKEAKLLSVEKENSAVLEVIQGKADAFIYDQMSVWQNWKKNPVTTRAILTPLQKEYWAIGVRKDNEALRLKINEFLKDFRAKGGFEQLGDKYLGEQKEAFRKEGIPFYF